MVYPYPEEMNRRFTDMVATLHIAPTQWSRENLLREGVAPERIFVTGNPVVDALQIALPNWTMCLSLEFRLMSSNGNVSSCSPPIDGKITVRRWRTSVAPFVN